MFQHPGLYLLRLQNKHYHIVLLYLMPVISSLDIVARNIQLRVWSKVMVDCLSYIHVTIYSMKY